MDEILEKMKIFDENFAEIKDNIATAAKKSGRKAEDITLLAATKTVPAEVINYAFSKGLTHMGENRVQEYFEKLPHLTASLEQRHFIGHLQTNKVAKLVGTVSMIQSVGSERLAEEISKRSLEKGIVTPVLLEVNIGLEQSKSGAAPETIVSLAEKCGQLKGIKVEGLMAIPPIEEQNDKMREIFSNIYQLYIDIRDKKIDNIMMNTLSMGMSSDYELAIEEGATMVRVGSSLFGKRIYK